MANPGTAVTTLWNAQSEKKIGINGQAIKREETQLQVQQSDFTKLLTDNKLVVVAEQTGLLNKQKQASKVTTMASLVTNLSNLVGSVGTTSNQGMVTAFITSRPTSGVTTTTNITQLQKPVIMAPTQPMLLPKPLAKQVIPATPPKMGFTPNPTVLTSPVLCSPGHSWKTGIQASPVNRKRLRPEFDLEQLDSKRRRTPSRCGPEKSGKGLRHFSMKVCEKVQQKGITSYNEVADELVQEFSEQSMKNPIQTSDQSYDQKNIRRRVYDALNVLMAMNIISKEKKEIKWVGLPTNSAQECKHLEEQKGERIERIRQKQQQLKELLVQQIAFKNLVERNKRMEKKSGPPQANACINLPFIIVNTSKKTVIDCSISSDKSEYLFNFDEAFEIHDDIEVLKRMGLSFGLEKGECGEKNLKVARTMVPKALESYVMQMANGTYGDMELIDVDKIKRPISPLATPLMIGSSSTTTTNSKSPPNTSKQRATTRKRKSTTTNNNSRITVAAAMSSITTQHTSYTTTSACGESDTENDGDDENSSVGMNQ